MPTCIRKHDSPPNEKGQFFCFCLLRPAPFWSKFSRKTGTGKKNLMATQGKSPKNTFLCFPRSSFINQNISCESIQNLLNCRSADLFQHPIHLEKPEPLSCLLCRQPGSSNELALDVCYHKTGCSPSWQRSTRCRVWFVFQGTTFAQRIINSSARKVAVPRASATFISSSCCSLENLELKVEDIPVAFRVFFLHPLKCAISCCTCD